MITKTHVRTLPLTPILAAKFAAMQPLAGERELKEKRLNFLETHVRRGTFFGPEWADVVERSTGKTYRANGQHSSTMLSRLPEEKFPVGLQAYITRYEIDSVAQDGLDLFDLFDNPNATRNGEDVMGVGKAAYYELDNITRKFLIKVAKGLNVHIRSKNDELLAAYEKAVKKNPDAVRPTPESVPTSRRLSLYFGDPNKRQFAVWMNKLSIPPYAGKTAVVNEFLFGQAGVVAVMYGDWKRDAEFASTFWSEVLNESNPDVESTSRELAVELRKLNTKDKKNQKDFRKAAAKASRNAAALMKQEAYATAA